MENDPNSSNDKLVLMNDQTFSFVYTAGTNVKKFMQQVRKHDQNNIREISDFVLHLVESRNLPLEVKAKIVCGMSRIILHTSRNILAEVLAIQTSSSKGRRNGYGEKNVVREMKLQLEHKTNGKNSGTAVPLDLDLAVANFDIDIQEKITEKEVICMLVSCKDATTVKNVDDITLRDMPPWENYSTELQPIEANDFGETMLSEMLDFFYSDDEPTLTDTAVEKIHEPASLGDINIDLSVETDVDMENNMGYVEHQLLPLEDTLQPLPMETYDEDGAHKMLSIANNCSTEASIHEMNDDGTSSSASPEDVIEKEETQLMKHTGGRKRLLIIDECTTISAKCYQRWISDWLTVYSKKQNSDLKTIIAEHELQHLFTKPLRNICNSYIFYSDALISRNRNRRSNNEKHPAKRICISDNPPVQATDEQQDAVDLPAIETTNDPHFASLLPTKTSEMKNFLNSFTGNPSQWNYLKNCEPAANEDDKQKRNDEGVVSRYAIKTLLDSMFREVKDNSLPFKLLQAKMSNRLVAVSLFSKLLELSKEKIIRVSTDENGAPVSVHKFTNWE